MYKLERQNKLIEEFMLGDEVIRVEITADKIIDSFYQKQSAVLAAQVKIRQFKETGKLISEDAMQEYGVAIISFLELLLGAETTAKILKYYDNNYIELFAQVMPFVSNVLIPKTMAMLEEIKNKATTKYTGKANREMRRTAKKFK